MLTHKSWESFKQFSVDSDIPPTESLDPQNKDDDRKDVLNLIDKLRYKFL